MDRSKFWTLALAIVSMLVACAHGQRIGFDDSDPDGAGGDGGAYGEGAGTSTTAASGSTATTTSSTTTTSTTTSDGPECGDAQCDAGETCQSCATDCGACGPVCSNGLCEAGESCQSCAQDCGPCGPVCNNGICEAGESCQTCPGDCSCVCSHAVCTTGVALVDGCDPCVTDICAVDPFCCASAWDFVCVEAVATVCGQACGGACAHDPCVAGGPLADGCDPCVSDVCWYDSYCCTIEWDFLCVDDAVNQCGIVCP